MEKKRKILVISPAWIGDIVMTHSLYRLLTQINSNVEIDVIAPEWATPLINRMKEINKLITTSFKRKSIEFIKRYKLGKLIEKNYYHQSLILPTSLKSALIPFIANIPKRTGWRGEIRYFLVNDMRILHSHLFPSMIQRYASFAFERNIVKSAKDLPTKIPWPSFKVTEQEIDEIFSTFSFKRDRPIIGLCPGSSSGPSKKWPHYYHAVLIKHLIENNYQIILLGASSELEISKKILDLVPLDLQKFCHNFVGMTSLNQAIILIASCKGIVTNDTGLMHIASALKRPLVALYGPSSPVLNPPLSLNSKILHRVNGYYKIKKSYNKYGYHKSLIDISPNEVIIELTKVLANS